MSVNEIDEDESLTDEEAKSILGGVARKVQDAQAGRRPQVVLERYEAYLAIGLAGHFIELIENVVHGDCDVLTIRGVHFVRARKTEAT